MYQFLHRSFCLRALIPKGLDRNHCIRSQICHVERRWRSMYASGVKATGSGARVIDMRSDTVTKPSEDMRAAMAAAEVGDDVYEEDPTTNDLQAKAAQMLRKDAALFVPSGTMGNLVSIMGHCGCRGDEMLVGDESHIVHYEQGGASQIAGVHTRQVCTHPDGTLDLSDLESKVRSVIDPHFPVTRLLCLEQTHAYHGGRVLPLAYFDKVKDFASKYNLKIHLDGARLFHAAAVLSVPVAEVVEHVDSVSFCLSKEKEKRKLKFVTLGGSSVVCRKTVGDRHINHPVFKFQPNGLGAPVGSLVVGSKDFIARCVRHRKVLGGGMRQSGVLAAAGMYALENMPQRLHEDHVNAKTLAEGLQKISGLNIDLNTVETNMIVFNVNKLGMTADDLVLKMGTVGKTQHKDDEVIVQMLSMGKYRARLVLHHQVSADDVRRVLQKFQLVMGG